jgi:hypothetical protein
MGTAGREITHLRRLGMRLLIATVSCALIAGCGSSQQADQEPQDTTLDGISEALAECRHAYPDEIIQAVARAACVNKAIAPLRPLLRFPDCLTRKSRCESRSPGWSRTTNCRCSISSCKSPNCIKGCWRRKKAGFRPIHRCPPRNRPQPPCGENPIPLLARRWAGIRNVAIDWRMRCRGGD